MNEEKNDKETWTIRLTFEAAKDACTADTLTRATLNWAESILIPALGRCVRLEIDKSDY